MGAPGLPRATERGRSAMNKHGSGCPCAGSQGSGQRGLWGWPGVGQRGWHQPSHMASVVRPWGTDVPGGGGLRRHRPASFQDVHAQAASEVKDNPALMGLCVQREVTRMSPALLQYFMSANYSLQTSHTPMWVHLIIHTTTEKEEQRGLGICPRVTAS